MFIQSFPYIHHYIRFSLLPYETNRVSVIIPILQIRKLRNRLFNYTHTYTLPTTPIPPLSPGLRRLNLN